MKLLLDTHIFLWYITADLRLPTLFCNANRESKNKVFLSFIMEIIVKCNFGKLYLRTKPI